ncbi:MAG TPA: class I SAM-dependent methyltransferase [Candidatus Binatia bacterium]|jgi:23S rRNA (cytosine1962-C5)-methyltransferase|nr:class I SAM-dependent methyltransferase [Candidatus Binatia bacterium]
MSGRKSGKTSAARLRLRVSATAETILRSGHPWLFADSIREQNRQGKLGELAVVYDRKDRFLALGLFDPESPIRVRVLVRGKPQELDRAWWPARLEQALEKRQGLFDDQTTGHRWLNGESDGWPGLVLDRYDRTLVLKLYTAAWLPHLEDIAGIIQQQLQPERIVLRLSRNIQETAATRFGKKDGEILQGLPLGGPVVFLEKGLRFEADVLRGQKTGFFLDQRENRRRVEALARGRTVLNTFSFSGGFSLYAARGGALSVTDLDLSDYALVAAKRNFALNQSEPAVAACSHETIQAEAFEWLNHKPRRKFGLIVLDPPSLAKREAERAGAIRAYGRLTALAIEHLEPAGILVACSCSAHVSAEEFFAVVRRETSRAGRVFKELETTHHPPDHPAGFKEARYLKATYQSSASSSKSNGGVNPV